MALAVRQVGLAVIAVITTAGATPAGKWEAAAKAQQH